MYMSKHEYYSYKETIINAILQCNNLVEEHRKALQKLDFEIDDLHQALQDLEIAFSGTKN